MFLSFDLPKNRIASRPVAERDAAKLLYQCEGVLEDKVFSELPDLLASGDLLVVNQTKVRPSRFFSVRERDDRKFELLLLSRVSEANNKFETWESLAKPLKKLKVGDVLQISDALIAKVGERVKDSRAVELILESKSGPLAAAIEAAGLMPIPPYIRKGEADKLDQDDYQTVYASSAIELSGSIAAPTAGLHLTKELLERIENQGVELGVLVLEVGSASIVSVSEENFRQTKMPEELFCIPQKLQQQLKQVKRRGGKVVAVGTSSVRALESAAAGGLLQLPSKENKRFIKSYENDFFGTELFIAPGFNFQIVDKLITNFHLPNSSHLSLVNAFCGASLTEKIYQHALAKDYRFFSYGDAMLLS